MTAPAIWEPRIWQVGDRVRARVSPECQVWIDGKHGYRTSTWTEKVPSDITGRVFYVREHESAIGGHRFMVTGRVSKTSLCRFWVGFFAAIELDPADDDAV